jgi:hypothetical protein
MGREITQVTVRNEQLETDLLELLQEDPRKLWNISGLQRHFNCSREKVKLAATALQAQGKVEFEKASTAWFVRLPRQAPPDKKGRV